MAEKYDELKKQMTNKSVNPAKYLPRVIEEIKKDDSKEFAKACRYELRDDIIDRVKAAKNKHEKLMIELCIECMKKKTQPYYELAKKIFDEKAVVRWKGHEDAIERMIQILEEPIEWEPTDREKEDIKEKHVSWDNQGRALKDAVEEMIKACSRDKMIKKVAPSFSRLLSSAIKSGSDMHIVVAIAIVGTSEMEWEGYEKLIPDVLEAYDKWLRGDNIDLEENRDHRDLAGSVTSYGTLLENAGKSSVPHLKSLMEYCMDQELEGDEQPLSVHGRILQSIITGFIMRNTQKVKIFKDLLPYVVKLLSCDIKDLESMAGYAIGTVYQNGELLAPYGDDIADAYLDNKCEGTTVGMALKGIFQYKPEVVLSRVDRIFEKMDDMGSSDKMYLYMLLDDVGKKDAEVLVPHIDLMFEDICDTSLSTMAFMTLANISIDHATHFAKHLDKCLKAWEQIPHTVASACKTIASIGRLNKKEAERCLKIFFGKVNSIDPMWISVILMEVKRIGQAHKECLDVYRPQIEKLKTCQQMGVPDMVQSMIDFLDDRSLHGLSEEVAEQREDIDNLDSRVTNTENDVTRIDETVTQQGDDIQNVKNEVNEQGERLDELKEVVDETVVKVEEIDHKTITNAPKWSRDVSKLLNPEHEHDWRFLAVRLGYSGEDIRNWALSPDPTMAILAEWYTTHKSSDATYAILSALEDMGRTDAAEIITQSLEEAELLVPQAPPDESEKPPTVFLSYQWDHQLEVKAIKKHLEMAGFPCWMDIGQMGGGDQLFSKISQGMRSSKLVLCMVTEKYSNSENCNKEVNLANLLNKPIIPILIDQTQWPPQGAMSMLFAQLLYIQFYNDKEYVRGEKFWEDAKFSELLGQISYHANPDESMISDEYRDWIPQVEDKPVTVKKVSEEAKSSPAQQNQTMESTEAPSIFISYQWDKQTEIKRLFSRLTGLGYHCWLDINQMGGGDPLYSKIDKGVRNAKVVVSCVTPKYSLSANCRREVSLSDALRKPIIPLLLEEMTWPPEGPMSMTFTQLLYIDFTKETTQASFEDEKFEELIEKIKEHAEPTLQLEPTCEQDEMKVTSQEQSPTPTPKEEGTAETSVTKDIPPSADASDSDTKPVEEVPVAVERSATPPAEQPPPKQSDKSPVKKPSSPSPSEKKNKKSSTCLLL
uniref:MyD88-like protein L1 n=1 Tax=Strongylocentrotus purpuratus TaxID=7668 RepID=A0A9E8IDW3_STRPU|nr:MyD88-like protein L1 [Strongylocentrotus purpuratus]